MKKPAKTKAQTKIDRDFILIEFPVFCGYIVHFELCNDLAQAMMQYKSCRGISVSDTEGITVHVTDNPMTFIFLKRSASPGVVAHEAYHAARQMLRYFQCDPDNESVAYHLGYIVNQMSGFMRKRKTGS